MTHRGEVKRLAEQAIATLGKVDILINNAGGNTPQPIDQITDEVWDHFVELNLSSCMALYAGPGSPDERPEVGPCNSHFINRLSSNLRRQERGKSPAALRSFALPGNTEETDGEPRQGGIDDSGKAERRNLPRRRYPELPLDIQHFHWKPPFVTRRNTRPRERRSFSSPPVPCGKKQRVARSARHELVDKVQDCLFAQGLAGRTTGGRTSSICARAFSIHGGRRSLLPSSSIVSSGVNPGGSVAISKRMPPGSRK